MLKPGLQAMHNGHAVKLLYLAWIKTDGNEEVQTWKCQLLFVEPTEVLEEFKKGERVTPLHSKW